MFTVQAIPVDMITDKDPVRSRTCEDLALMKKSIESNGQYLPITLNQKLELLDGQLRLEAVKELGHKRIKAIIL